MFPFTLYLVTALVTGSQIYWTLMWAIWGAPTSPIEYLALIGSFALLVASFVSLFRSRSGSYAAFAACLLLWSFYAPASFVTITGKNGNHLLLDLFIYLGVPLSLLIATTSYAWVLLFHKPVSPVWLFPASATTRARVYVGLVTLLIIPTFALIDMFAIGTERTIVKEADWSYGKIPNEKGERGIVLRYVGYPNCFEILYSPQLETYLKTQADKPVTVTIQLTSDFGKVRGTSIRQVGAFTDMTSLEGISHSGNDNQCPF